MIKQVRKNEQHFLQAGENYVEEYNGKNQKVPQPIHSNAGRVWKYINKNTPESYQIQNKKLVVYNNPLMDHEKYGNKSVDYWNDLQNSFYEKPQNCAYKLDAVSFLANVKSSKVNQIPNEGYSYINERSVDDMGLIEIAGLKPEKYQEQKRPQSTNFSKSKVFRNKPVSDNLRSSFDFNKINDSFVFKKGALKNYFEKYYSKDKTNNLLDKNSGPIKQNLNFNAHNFSQDNIRNKLKTNSNNNQVIGQQNQKLEPKNKLISQSECFNIYPKKGSIQTDRYKNQSEAETINLGDTVQSNIDLKINDIGKLELSVKKLRNHNNLYDYCKYKNPLTQSSVLARNDSSNLIKKAGIFEKNRNSGSIDKTLLQIDRVKPSSGSIEKRQYLGKMNSMVNNKFSFNSRKSIIFGNNSADKQDTDSKKLNNRYINSKSLDNSRNYDNETDSVRKSYDKKCKTGKNSVIMSDSPREEDETKSQKKARKKRESKFNKLKDLTWEQKYKLAMSVNKVIHKNRDAEHQDYIDEEHRLCTVDKKNLNIHKRILTNKKIRTERLYIGKSGYPWRRRSWYIAQGLLIHKIRKNWYYDAQEDNYELQDYLDMRHKRPEWVEKLPENEEDYNRYIKLARGNTSQNNSLQFQSKQRKEGIMYF